MRVCVPEDANQPLAAAAFYPALAHASQHRMRQREIGYRAERRVTACRRAKAYRKRISENITACDESKINAQFNLVGALRSCSDGWYHRIVLCHCELDLIQRAGARTGPALNEFLRR